GPRHARHRLTRGFDGLFQVGFCMSRTDVPDTAADKADTAGSHATNKRSISLDVVDSDDIPIVSDSNRISVHGRLTQETHVKHRSWPGHQDGKTGRLSNGCQLSP